MCAGGWGQAIHVEDNTLGTITPRPAPVVKGVLWLTKRMFHQSPWLFYYCLVKALVSRYCLEATHTVYIVQILNKITLKNHSASLYSLLMLPPTSYQSLTS